MNKVRNIILLLCISSSILRADDMSQIGYALLGGCAASGDTAYILSRGYLNEELVINPSFAYGLPNNYALSSIAIVDSTEFGSVVVDETSKTIRYLSTENPINADRLVILLNGVKPLYIDIDLMDRGTYLEEGYDFWIAFTEGPKEGDGYPIETEVIENPYFFRILASVPTHVRIINHKGQIIEQDIAKNTYFEGQYGKDLIASNRGIHIESSAPVVVESNKYMPYDEDATVNLPTSALGINYILQSFELLGKSTKKSRYCVLATNNNTQVQIGNNAPFLLQQGQVYRDSSFTEITGTLIHSNKPIAVYQGGVCNQCEKGCKIDQLFEQARPTIHAGTEFAAVISPTAAGYDYIQVVTKDGGKTIYDSGRDNKCQFITSDQPAMAQMFLMGGYHALNLESYSDPDMYYMRPLNECYNYSIFSRQRIAMDPANPYSANEVLIVSKTKELYLDGQLLTGFQTLANGYFYLVRSTGLEDAIHVLYSPSPNSFIAVQLGYFEADSYSYALPPIHCPKRLTVLKDSMCLNDTYHWKGKEYMQEGVYMDTTAVGIDMLKLTTYAVDTIIDSTQICIGDSIEWRGKMISKSGEYRDTLDCDLYLLYVSNLDTTNSDTTMSICERELPYLWNGISCLTAGTYRKEHLVNSAGCDSTAILHLEVLSHFAKDTIISICKKDLPYHWYEHTLTKKSVVTHTIANPLGCDSVITLHLYILKECSDDHPLNPTIDCDTAYSTTYQQIYEKELPFEWNGQKVPTIPQNERQDTTLVAPLKKEDLSCDSIATLHLHVLFPCELPTIYLPVKWKQ